MKKLWTIIALCLCFLALPAAAWAAQPDSLVISGRDAVVAAGETVTSVVVIAGDARIAGHVEEAVVAVGGSIYLEPGAVVEGDVVSLGGRIERQGDAKIEGQQVSLGSLSLQGLQIGSGWANWLRAGLSVWRLLAVLFLGAVLFWMCPRQLATVTEAVNGNPLRAVIFGGLGYLALIPLSIILLITILGIPLIPLIWLAMFAARLFGQVALGSLAGRWLGKSLNWQLTPLALTLLGLLALGLLAALPVVGGLAGLFYGLVGFGAVLWTRFGTKPATFVVKE